MRAQKVFQQVHLRTSPESSRTSNPVKGFSGTLIPTTVGQWRENCCLSIRLSGWQVTVTLRRAYCCNIRGLRTPNYHKSQSLSLVCNNTGWGKAPGNRQQWRLGWLEVDPTWFRMRTIHSNTVLPPLPAVTRTQLTVSARTSPSVGSSGPDVDRCINQLLKPPMSHSLLQSPRVLKFLQYDSFPQLYPASRIQLCRFGKNKARFSPTQTCWGCGSHY